MLNFAPSAHCASFLIRVLPTEAVWRLPEAQSVGGNVLSQIEFLPFLLPFIEGLLVLLFCGTQLGDSVVCYFDLDAAFSIDWSDGLWLSLGFCSLRLVFE